MKYEGKPDRETASFTGKVAIEDLIVQGYDEEEAAWMIAVASAFLTEDRDEISLSDKF